MRTAISVLPVIAAALALAPARAELPAEPSSNATEIVTTAPAPAPAPSPALMPATGGDYVPDTSYLFKRKDQVLYATGGIGDEEMAALKLNERNYNLRVMAAIPGGNYIGDYTLRIRDTQGTTVLEAPGEGPYFYVQLPPGTYTVEAVSESGRQQQKITIGAGGTRQIVFRWNES